MLQRRYDLEDRCLAFAKRVRVLVSKLPSNTANWEDGKQLVRSSGSVGANYIEANEGLGKNDFLMHVRISRKEAKESRFWLRMIDTGGDAALEPERISLIQEATELLLIFNAMIQNTLNPI